jgi:hypothetical protein
VARRREEKKSRTARRGRGDEDGLLQQPNDSRRYVCLAWQAACAARAATTPAHSETRSDAKHDSPSGGVEGTGRGAGFLSEIMSDVSLTPDERWLMIEALFVHDASAPSFPANNAPEQIAAAGRVLTPRRKPRERLPTEVGSGATLGAGLNGASVARAR